MSVNETLGVLAHRGGLVVERPELSVGVVRAVSRPIGLELELLARRPLDRRDAAQRQADIRAGRTVASIAPRRLLPPHDEGVDLRVGWLDHNGRAHWEYGSVSSSSGDHFAGGNGPSLRTILRLPPLFDHLSLVLAWPEIGFPETVVELPLPDRATVERDTISIWDAPPTVRPAPTVLNHRVAAVPLAELAVETGQIIAGPRVLSRDLDAAVVLTRLTAVGEMLSMEILSLANGERAPSYEPRRNPHHPGAAIAVMYDHDAAWVEQYESAAEGGPNRFRSTAVFDVQRPNDSVLALLVAWPAAGLPDGYVEIPLGGNL
jgi:hypothetical protein